MTVVLFLALAEIKDLKIPMGAPGFKYAGLIKNGGTLLSSNYALYADMSARVMEVLSMFLHLKLKYTVLMKHF